MTVIMNTGRVPLQVGVIQTSTGTKGSMRVMGRGRHVLMEGYTVDPNWIALYGKTVKIVEDKPVVSPTPVVTTSTPGVPTTPAPTV